MHKLSLLAVLAFGVVAFAPAQPKAPTKKTIKCAVMPAADVNIAAATKKKMYADHKGRRYFFCCPGCPEAFRNNPAKYAKGPSIPTPKAPVKKKKKA